MDDEMPTTEQLREGLQTFPWIWTAEASREAARFFSKAAAALENEQDELAESLVERGMNKALMVNIACQMVSQVRKDLRLAEQEAALDSSFDVTGAAEAFLREQGKE